MPPAYVFKRSDVVGFPTVGAAPGVPPSYPVRTSDSALISGGFADAVSHAPAEVTTLEGRTSQASTFLTYVVMAQVSSTLAASPQSATLIGSPVLVSYSVVTERNRSGRPPSRAVRVLLDDCPTKFDRSTKAGSSVPGKDTFCSAVWWIA